MKQVYQWIQDLEDGVITEDDRRELMELMRNDPQVRLLYRQHMSLAAMLQQTAETKAELGTMPVSSAMVQQERKKSALKALSYGMAAMILLGFVAYFYQIQQPRTSSELVMEYSDDTVLSVTSIDPEHTGIQVGDKLSIQQGLVRLEFPTGVEALVEGPCELELLSQSELKMDQGRAWFHVPEEGQGFTVVTDRMKVVDLGTEFGIWFEPSGHLQVHVSKGKVRVEPELLHQQDTELVAMEAMRFDPFARGEKISAQFGSFRRKFNKDMLYAHWSFDKLVDGSYPADGTLAGVENFQAKLSHTDSSEKINTDGCQVEGKMGNAFHMDGNGLFAETQFYGIAGNTPRTIAMWVNHREGPMLSGVRIPYVAWGTREKENGATWRLVIRGKKNATLMSSTVGTSLTSKVSITDQWTHIASVYTGKKCADGYPEIQHFINGEEIDVKTSERPIDVNTMIAAPHSKPVRFGASILEGFERQTINADLDEVFIIRGVLTPAQIKQLMEKNQISSAE